MYELKVLRKGDHFYNKNPWNEHPAVLVSAKVVLMYII